MNGQQTPPDNAGRPGTRDKGWKPAFPRITQGRPVFEASLPMPPSVNAAYRNVRGVGRVKSKTYKAWEIASEWKVLFKTKPLEGPLLMTIRLGFNGRQMKTADVANREKVISDLLVSKMVLQDDTAWVVATIIIGVDKDVEEGQVLVSLYRWPDELAL